MRRLHRIVQAQREEDPPSATFPKPEARPLRALNLVPCSVADLNVWRKAFGAEWFGSAFGSELGVVGEEIERATTRRDMESHHEWFEGPVERLTRYEKSSIHSVGAIIRTKRSAS
jgi:hypothetical protein